ncbi:hypothetical protein XELAEV_18037754mg [Xenopus laevis]|uniref:Immunoglobulin V-set domain-containing protein n=1 Tax=Xenopus laevis TaxID=8355 RepID=A0A974CDW6_XENLA|nr:hypothetical protein XELAEV_18037754mg [Xenopus laevis]
MVAASSLTIELIPQCALIGKNVTLSVSEINGMLKSFSWYLGDAPSASNQIINYLVGLTPPTTNGPKHFTDAIGLPNGSLLITNLKEEYSNTYTVQVQADSPDRASADLIVTSRRRPMPRPRQNWTDHIPAEIASDVIGLILGFHLSQSWLRFSITKE